MPGREVILWAVDEEVADGQDLRSPERVTDVFHRQLRPKPGSLVIGIAMTPTDEADREPSAVLVGVARQSQQVAKGKDRTVIASVARLPHPVPLRQVDAELPEPLRRRMDITNRLPAPLAPVRLTPHLGQALVDALTRLSPAAADWLGALHTAETPIIGGHAARLREERDAVALAIDLAGVPAPDNLLHTPGDTLDPSAPFGAAFNPLYVMDNEDDIITEDLRRFDRRSQLRMQSSGIARFTSDKFALTVMNVNRKPLEHALGVDLVYYDEIAQIFTLVQYKRLARRPATSERGYPKWIYTDRTELDEQLQRMDIGPNEPVNSKDWRMAPSPFWFKFVRAEDFTPGDPFVLKGMYVPADYLRLALADGSLRTGPRTGFEVTYTNTRFLPREVFVELVRRGFAGTTRAGTHAVVEVAAQRARTQEVVLALKTPIGEDEPRNRGHRATRDITL